MNTDHIHTTRNIYDFLRSCTFFIMCLCTVAYYVAHVAHWTQNREKRTQSHLITFNSGLWHLLILVCNRAENLFYFVPH